MPIRTRAVRLHGRNDLRLDTFDLPDPADDEILAEVLTDSICMSSHKAAEQGTNHKRVPKDIATNPVIIGHEFAGRLLWVGPKWRDRFEVGQVFAIQPALMYKGSLDSPGYSFRFIGGNATKIVIPQEVMVMDCLLPYSGDAFFKASLAEPMSCIVGAFRAQYHWSPGTYTYKHGIRKGGNCALLAAAGPMGFGAIDWAIHGPRKPKRLVVTDIDPSRLARARALYPPEEAEGQGVQLVYVNPNELEGGQGALPDYVRRLTDGRMMDDVFVFFPHPALIAQADSLLGRNGCLNFFAGPTDQKFTAPFNFYNVHYEGHHLVGTSGGNTEDMRISLDYMSRGVVNPSAMVTHVGGLDAAPEAILNLPSIPGGKKLIYTHVRMPLTPLDGLGEAAARAEGPLSEVFAELDRLVRAHNGLWSVEAEQVMLSSREIQFAEN